MNHGWSRELDHLDQRAVGREPGESQPVRLERLAVGVVELVAVAVALADLLLAVELARRASRRSSTHGYAPRRIVPPFCVESLLRRHQVDHRMRRLGIDLGGVGAARARRRGGRTRSPPSACRSRCRRTARAARARSARRRSCPRCRAARSPPAPGSPSASCTLPGAPPSRSPRSRRSRARRVHSLAMPPCVSASFRLL